jgi:hypothetical protein
MLVRLCCCLLESLTVVTFTAPVHAEGFVKQVAYRCKLHNRIEMTGALAFCDD